MDKMTIITLNEQLQKKDLLLGFCLSYPAPGIIERIGADWDWIWIDAQHGQHDYNSILECVRACERVRTPSVVRVPSHDYGSIGLVLDTCACGVMIPMINTSEEARLAVKAAKFPPTGLRSYGGRRPIDIYGRSYSHTANNDTLLIAQIETEEGLKNVDEIASVAGVDALFFGPDDMAMQSALPMDKPREVDFFKSAMSKIAVSALKAGKIAGTVTASTEMLDIAVKMGYRLCVATSDVALLAGGSGKMRENFSGITSKIKKK
jgi:4-hydroxy-2-oxoheptanedioate aldolase